METVPGTAGLHMHTNISDVGMGWGAIDGAPLFCVVLKNCTDMQLCQHTIINGTTILKQLHTSLYIDTHAHEHDMHINEMWTGFHTEGGCPGISPPQGPVFPPPRISYHNVIMNQIENCTSINAYRLMRLFFCLNV